VVLVSPRIFSVLPLTSTADTDRSVAFQRTRQVNLQRGLRSGSSDPHSLSSLSTFGLTVFLPLQFEPSSSGSTSFQINRVSSVNPNHLAFFRFVGVIVGQSASPVLDVFFSRPLADTLFTFTTLQRKRSKTADSSTPTSSAPFIVNYLERRT
jgi:hypothetical protein